MVPTVHGYCTAYCKRHLKAPVRHYCRNSVRMLCPTASASGPQHTLPAASLSDYYCTSLLCCVVSDSCALSSRLSCTPQSETAHE